MQKDNLKKSTIDYFVRAARTAAQAEITYGQIKPEELDGGATPTDLLQKDLQIAVRFLAGAEQNYQNKVIFDPRLTPADFIEIKKSVWEKLSSAERQIFQRAFDGDGESRESAAYLLETEEDSEKPRAIAAQQEYAADIEAAIAEDKSDTSGTPLGKYGDVWGVGFYIYQYIATAGLAIGLLTNPSGFLTDPVTLAYAAVGAGFAGHYGLFDGKLQTPGVRSREDLADMLAATERKQEYQKYKPILSAIRETQFQPDSALAGLLREKTLAGEITTADLTADLLQHDVQPDGLPKIESGSSEARWLFSFLADCVEGQVNPKELIAQAEN